MEHLYFGQRDAATPRSGNITSTQRLRLGYIRENKQLSALKGLHNATLLEELKRNSSRWIKTKGDEYAYFAWQGGYGGFSVSQSKVDVVKRYIENQKEHHKIETVKDEYIKFLKEYGIDYNEDYLWT